MELWTEKGRRGASMKNGTKIVIPKTKKQREKDTKREWERKNTKEETKENENEKKTKEKSFNFIKAMPCNFIYSHLANDVR